MAQYITDIVHGLFVSQCHLQVLIYDIHGYSYSLIDPVNEVEVISVNVIP